MATEIFLLNISGQDKPGLTSALTSVLSQYEAKILDIGQANIHDTLSLGILLRFILVAIILAILYVLIYLIKHSLHLFFSSISSSS